MISTFNRYRTLEKNSLNLIISESSLQLINGSLMLILFLYMGELGYSNSEKAFYFVFRFTSVLFFSFPYGLWIKGKKLLPFFKISAFTLPIITLLMLYAIHEKIDWLIILTFFLWGLSFSFSQICKLPFVLRHCPKDQVTEGITLSYSTWSFGNVLGGTLIFTLSNLLPTIFTSQNCIVFIAIFSYFSLYFLYKVEPKEKLGNLDQSSNNLKLKNYDWNLIFQGLFPTFLIAIGAGMSIPFMNIYFEQTFDMSFSNYAALGFVTHCFVFLMILQSPYVKSKFGYKKAIPITQTLAVLALIILGVFESYSSKPYVFYFAIFFFVIRQPLMNIAQPMTTDIIMKYVGEKNHEIVSALFALIWNGSFVISGLLFAYLSALNLPFMYIFSYTAIFYFIAIVWYIWLIRKIEK